MFICYESVAGVTSTLTASSKAGPFVSQVRKYSDAITISEASLTVRGTFDGETRANYQVEITDLGSQVVPTLPVYRDVNFGQGFIKLSPDTSYGVQEGITTTNITDKVSIAGGGTYQLWIGDHIIGDGSSLILAHEYQFNKIFVGMCNANVDAATLFGYYWNGSSWKSLEGVVDHTKSGGISLSGDGIIEWKTPSDWVQDVLFVDQNSRYWMHFAWSDGITGILGNISIKSRAEVGSGYSVEQEFTLECTTLAAGASGALFSLTGSVDGDFGTYEAGVRQQVDGVSVWFHIWEDPDYEWYNVTRAKATYRYDDNDGYIIFYSDPALPPDFANTLSIHWAKTTSPTSYGYQPYGISKPPMPIPDYEFYPDTGIFLEVRDGEGNSLDLFCRRADGTTGNTHEYLIDMVNDGYRYDRHYVRFKTVSHISSYAGFSGKRIVAGLCSGYVFFYIIDGHMIRASVSDGTTHDMSVDPNYSTWEYMNSISAGLTIYAVGNNGSPRIFMYNMRDDVWTEGNASGLTDPFASDVYPAITYDPENHVVYFMGLNDNAEGRKIFQYDPVADGTSAVSDELWTESSTETHGIGYSEPMGEIHIFQVRGPISEGGATPLIFNLGDGTTSQWTSGNYFTEDGSGWTFKHDPMLDRFILANANRQHKLYPGLRVAYKFYDTTWSGNDGDVHVFDAIPDSGVNPDQLSITLHSISNGVLHIRGLGPWNKLVSGGSTFIMFQPTAGGTWTTNEVVYEGLGVDGYDNFEGASDQGDTITFATAYGVFFKYTSDYEAASPTWVTNQLVEANAWVSIGNNIEMQFSEYLARYFNEGDFWRFFGDYRYRPENVYNWNQRETWRSTDGSSEWVLIDLGSGNARACDTVAILNSNFTPETTLFLQAGDGSSWDYPPFMEGLTVLSDGTLIKTFENSTAYRYYRLLANDDNLNFFELGGWFLGQGVTLEVDPAPPFGYVNEDQIVFGTTPYGSRGSRFQSEREVLNLRFPTMLQEDYTKLDDLRRVVKGGRQPFILGLAGETRFVRWMGDFGRNRRVETDGRNKIHQNIEMRFEEELP